MAVVATAVIAVSVIIWLVVQMQSDKATVLAEKARAAEQLKTMEKARQAEADARQAEAEADVVMWDGGNNDTPFYAPDLHIVVFDPHRPGHELTQPCQRHAFAARRLGLR